MVSLAIPNSSYESSLVYDPKGILTCDMLLLVTGVRPVRRPKQLRQSCFGLGGLGGLGPGLLRAGGASSSATTRSSRDVVVEQNNSGRDVLADRVEETTVVNVS